MASIPQSQHDLNINYYEQSASSDMSSFIIAGIIIIVVLLLYSMLRSDSCSEGFATSPTDKYASIDAGDYGKHVWSGLPHDLDSIESRFKSHTVPEKDAPASMTAMRHHSEHEYGKVY